MASAPKYVANTENTTRPVPRLRPARMYSLALVMRRDTHTPIANWMRT